MKEKEKKNEHSHLPNVLTLRNHIQPYPSVRSLDESNTSHLFITLFFFLSFFVWIFMYISWIWYFDTQQGCLSLLEITNIKKKKKESYKITNIIFKSFRSHKCPITHF